MTIQTDQDVAEFLASRINLEQSRGSSHIKRGYKLERMRALLERLGNPQKRLRSVHIAGTKGKGHTALLVDDNGKQRDGANAGHCPTHAVCDQCQCW